DISMACDGSTVTTPAAVSADCIASMSHTVSITVVGQFRLVTPLLSAFTGGQTIGLSSTAVAVPRELPPTPPPAPTPPPTPTPAPSPSASPSASPSGSLGASSSPSATPTSSPSSSAGSSPSGGPVSCYAPTASFTVLPSNPAKKTNVAFTDQSSHM